MSFSIKPTSLGNCEDSAQEDLGKILHFSLSEILRLQSSSYKVNRELENSQKLLSLQSLQYSWICQKNSILYHMNSYRICKNACLRFFKKLP